MRRYLRYYCEAFRLPDAHRRRPRSTGCGSRATARCARSSTAAARSSPSSATSATGTSPAPGAPRTSGRSPPWPSGCKPEEVFEEFLAFRESLGMTIIPLTGGVNPFPALREAARRPGIIPLLADRDLTARGVEVELCGHTARMALGPAALALAERRPLHPVVRSGHERARPRLGHRHHLPPAGRRARGGHHPRAGHRDDPGLRRRARRRDRASTPATGTCCSGSSSTTSTTTGARPAAAPRRRAR